ncbi:MAG: radical SAM protein [Patescibacteria group bacterium]|jgi:radical SAM protein with 4Fe4S-binding SPASM domain
MNKIIYRKERFGGIFFEPQTGKISYKWQKEIPDFLRQLSAEVITIDNPLVENCYLSAPETVGLDITQKCNLACKHCYKDSGKTAAEELTTNEIFSLIDHCRDIGVCFFFIAGGEPTMRADLFKIIKYAKNNDIRVILVSNGVYGQDILDRILETQPLQVRISLEGPEKINDFIRGKGSYQTAVNSLKYLKENGIDARISTHLCQLNKDCGEEIIKLANDLNVILKFSTVRPIGRAMNFDELGLLSAEDFYSTVKKILALKNKYPAVEIISDFDCVIGQKPLKMNPGDKNSHCFAAQKEVTVNCQGEIYACSFFSPYKEFVAGNLKTRKLIDVWSNSPVLKMMREKKPSAKCQACKYYKINCLGGCPALAYSLAGNIRALDPLCPKLRIDSDKITK